MADDMTYRASFILDVQDALSGYTKLRQEHLSTVSALGAGAGALTAVGAAFTAAGVGLGAGLLGAALAAGEFERKLDYFTAVAGPGAADQYDRIRQEALRLGNDTIYSADEIANSFIELAKSGVGVEELLAGIGEAVSSLGAATDMPLEDAARGLTTVLNTFGLAAEDAVAVVDKLAGAANSSSIDVNDLMLTLSYAGASAKVAGIEFDDVNTAIALLGERGIRGSKAGTGLRQMFDKLLAPTKKGTSALRELGIVTEDGTNKLLDMDGGLKPIPQLLDLLNGSLAGLTTSEKMDVLGNIFPITSLPTILNLLDGGSEAMARLNAEIGKTTALDVASARLDNLSGDLEILSGNLDTLVINLGSVSQGFMRWVTQGLVAVTQWLNTLDPAILGLIVGIASAAAGVLTFIGVAGLFAGAILNMMQLVLVLGPALQTLATIFPILTTAVARFKAVLLFPGTPIIAVILAIAGALAFFFTQTQQGQAVWAQLQVQFAAFMQSLQPLIPVLMELAGVVVGWLMSALQVLLPILISIGEFFMTTFGPAIAIVTQALSGVAGAFAGVGTSASGMQGIVEIATGIINGIVAAMPIIINALINLVTNILTTLIGLLPALIEAGLTLFMGLITAVVQVIPQLVSAVIGLITTLVPALIAQIPTIINAALQLFQGLLTALIQILPLLLQGVVQLLMGLVTALISAIPTLITAGIQLFMALIQALVQIIPLLLETIVTLIPQVIQMIVELIPMLLEAGIQLFMALVNAVIEIVPQLITTVIELIPVIITSLIQMIPVLIQGAIQLFMAIVQAVPQIISSLIPAIINLIPTIISTVIGLIPQLIQAAIQLFMAIVQAIPQIVGALVGALMDLGRQLIDGLVRGLQNAGSAVLDAIGGIVEGAIDWAKGLLGIKSPSRVFMAIGKNTIQGMINGIDNMKNSLRRSYNIVADSMDMFYDQVYAAREFDVMMNLQSQMSSPMSSLGAQFDELNEKLTEIADKETFNVEKLEVNNPEAEPASDSLPNAIRKTAFTLG